MSEKKQKRYTTRVGRAVHQDNLFFGRSVRDELAGSIGLWRALSMAIDGPALSDAQLEQLDALVSCSLAADPRIWPLKLPRVIGAYGSLWSSLAAAFLMIESAIVGPHPCEEAAEYFVRLRALRDANPELSAQALIDRSTQEGRLFGFGLPGRAYDERFVAVARWMEERAPAELPRAHWELLQEVAPVVLQKHGLKVNIATGFAVALLDMGFSPRQTVVMTTIIVLPCFLSNAYEGAFGSDSRLPERMGEEAARYVGRAAR